MVSNTSDDLPEPDTPVNTVIARLGMRSETSLRLCSRAPRTSMNPGTSSPAVVTRVSGGVAAGDHVRHGATRPSACQPVADVVGPSVVKRIGPLSDLETGAHGPH